MTTYSHQRVSEARHYLRGQWPAAVDRFSLERELIDRFELNQHEAGLLLAERAAAERIRARGLGTAATVTPMVDELLDQSRARQDNQPPANTEERELSIDLDAASPVGKEDRMIYHDHTVIDDKGNSIGTITDVIYDEKVDQPTWLIVNPGRFRADRYLPVHGSYPSEDGTIVTPFDKAWVTSGPKAQGEHVLSHAEEAALGEHYGLSSSQS